jgi:hypothetical protein
VTNKEMILTAEPKATLDYYESLRGAGKPCWFIRVGFQGRPLSGICASPKAAWKDSADSFKEFLRKEAA